MKHLYLMLAVMLITAIGTQPVFSQGESCDNPIPVSSFPQSFTGAQNVGQWFSFTATATGKITIETIGLTTEDTYIRVLDDFCVSPLAENDNFGGETQSKLSFLGTQGITYHIELKNNGSSASFQWMLTESAWQQGEICTNTKAAVAGLNVADHTAATDQWFAFTAPDNGQLTFSTCGQTSEDTYLEVRTTCGALPEPAADECGLQTTLTINCVKDQQYLICWKNHYTSATYNWLLEFTVSTGLPSSSSVVEVYPNPFNQQLTIETSQRGIAQIQLISLTGETVASYSKQIEGSATIDVAAVKSGVYLLQVIVDDEIIVKKVTKK